jgi:hypothetical protein
LTDAHGALGDFIRAVAALEPRDSAAVAAVQDMLGLHRRPPVAEPARDVGPWHGSLPASETELAVAKPPREVKLDEDAQHSATVRSGDRQPARLRLVRPASGKPAPPAWVTVPGPRISAEPAVRYTPPAEPLFGGVRLRALLTAVLATDVSEGELDISEVIRRICARRPIAELPRLDVPTLRRGVQLLVDVGRGMDPYAQDRNPLVSHVRGIVPGDRISVLYFVGCPGRGCGAGPRKKWSPWRPPSSGTPVVALTDVGIGGPIFDPERGQTSEWLDFASQLKGLGNPLAALVPYSADRWPIPLTKVMLFLHWSERASARQVTHARRRRR